MPIYQLPDELWFPPPSEYEDDIVAIGGDFSPARLLLAYKKGIFPWGRNNGEILWYCPAKRMVLRPSEVKISKSSRNLLNQNLFEIKVNTDFDAVVENCQNVYRKGQNGGTWLSDDLKYSLMELHRRGFAHSIESWQNGELVGGLYGISVGKVFTGDSMFSKVSNASKIALLKGSKILATQGFELIDCQYFTKHLESLGGYDIEREAFLEILNLS